MEPAVRLTMETQLRMTATLEYFAHTFKYILSNINGHNNLFFENKIFIDIVSEWSNITIRFATQRATRNGTLGQHVLLQGEAAAA